MSSAFPCVPMGQVCGEVLAKESSQIITLYLPLGQALSADFLWCGLLAGVSSVAGAGLAGCTF